MNRMITVASQFGPVTLSEIMSTIFSSHALIAANPIWCWSARLRRRDGQEETSWELAAQRCINVISICCLKPIIEMRFLADNSVENVAQIVSEDRVRWQDSEARIYSINHFLYSGSFLLLLHLLLHPITMTPFNSLQGDPQVYWSSLHLLHWLYLFPRIDCGRARSFLTCFCHLDVGHDENNLVFRTGDGIRHSLSLSPLAGWRVNSDLRGSRPSAWTSFYATPLH